MEGGGERLQRLARVDSLQGANLNLMHRTRATLTLAHRSGLQSPRLFQDYHWHHHHRTLLAGSRFPSMLHRSRFSDTRPRLARGSAQCRNYGLLCTCGQSSRSTQDPHSQCHTTCRRETCNAKSRARDGSKGAIGLSGDRGRR